MTGAHALKLLAAYGAIYVVWGSTYLAILYAVETIPPFLMMGVRHLIAGALLLGACAVASGRLPALGLWRAHLLPAALFFVGGHGLLAWGERSVPSGLAALLSATVPIWVVLFEMAGGGRRRLDAATLAGLAVGLAGVAVLLNPIGSETAGGVDLMGAAAVLLGSVAWAGGTLRSRAIPRRTSAIETAGMQMLSGGALLVLAGVIAGEPRVLALEAISLRSLAAVGYLTVFGSLIAFTAYSWLLGASSAVRVATYAYVNPPVAVFFGWLLAGEALTPNVLAGTVVIVLGVALIVTRRAARVSESRQAALPRAVALNE